MVGRVIFHGFILFIYLFIYLFTYLTLSLPNVVKGKFRPDLQISFSKHFEKQKVPCVSTGRELSFEWSHHRISSTNAKVTVTFQNSIKHSGSERVKDSRHEGEKILHAMDL